MKVKVLRESGYDESALGFSLSYNSTPERAKEILPKYAFGKSGETKFLESIYLWLDVIAPRFFWSESDTYRHSTKQSESTLHTITKSHLEKYDFEYDINPEHLSQLNYFIDNYNKETGKIEKEKLFLWIKNVLPEGFLQRRIWVINYRTLQNIYNQRKNHRLPQWHIFLDTVLSQIEHPEFIIPPEEKT